MLGPARAPLADDWKGKAAAQDGGVAVRMLEPSVHLSGMESGRRTSGATVAVRRRESGFMACGVQHGDEDDHYGLPVDGAEGETDAAAVPRRRVLRPALTAPEVVPMTEGKHRQAVDVLAAMIVDWWRREERSAAGDTTMDPG